MQAVGAAVLEASSLAVRDPGVQVAVEPALTPLHLSEGVDKMNSD
jgi:hypothetical protein